jgi:hypothetical protein
MEGEKKASLMGYARGVKKDMFSEGGGEESRGEQRESRAEGGSAIKSSKIRDMLLLDIKNMADRNREEEEQLQKSLAGLESDTYSYERKIKAYLEELRSREAKAEMAFRAKV